MGGKSTGSAPNYSGQGAGNFGGRRQMPATQGGGGWAGFLNSAAPRMQGGGPSGFYNAAMPMGGSRMGNALRGYGGGSTWNQPAQPSMGPGMPRGGALFAPPPPNSAASRIAAPMRQQTGLRDASGPPSAMQRMTTQPYGGMRGTPMNFGGQRPPYMGGTQPQQPPSRQDQLRNIQNIINSSRNPEETRRMYQGLAQNPGARDYLRSVQYARQGTRPYQAGGG